MVYFLYQFQLLVIDTCTFNILRMATSSSKACSQTGVAVPKTALSMRLVAPIINGGKGARLLIYIIRYAPHKIHSYLYDSAWWTCTCWYVHAHDRAKIWMTYFCYNICIRHSFILFYYVVPRRRLHIDYSESYGRNGCTVPCIICLRWYQVNVGHTTYYDIVADRLIALES